MRRRNGVISGLLLFVSVALPACHFSPFWNPPDEPCTGIGLPVFWPCYLLGLLASAWFWLPSGSFLRDCIGQMLAIEYRPVEARVARAIAMWSAVTAQYFMFFRDDNICGDAAAWGSGVTLVGSVALAHAAIVRMNEATRKLPRAQVR